MSLSVDILIEGKNVRESVISCIESCLRQIDTLASSGKYTFSIWYIDNASVDGTFDAVYEKFPKVNLRKVSGNHSGYAALSILWQEAAEQGADFYLLIDPRLTLADNAISCLLENSVFLNHSAMISGSVQDHQGNLILGGRARKGKLIEPDAVIPIPCQTFDGNVLLVPKSAFNVVGLPNTKMKGITIAWSYGMKAKKEDVPRMIAPGILGKYSQPLDIIERSPLIQIFLYDLNSSGAFFALRHFFVSIFKIIVPIK